MTALPATPQPRLKLALLLGAATVVATLALLPYYFGVLAPMQAGKTSLSPAAVGALMVLQYGLLSVVLGWLGLWFGERYGLTAPWLRAWVYREPAPRARSRWGLAILLGMASASIALAIMVDWRHLPHLPTAQLLDLAWRGALAMFQGGMVEEVLCRLFLVSMVVWLLARLGGGVRPWMYIAAIVVAALLFGVGHLPAAMRLGLAGDPLAIARIVVPNLVVGLPCGWLFWKYGLEHAMVAHFSADFLMHVGIQLAFAAFV